MVEALGQLVVRHALSESSVVVLLQRPVQHHLQLTCTGHIKESPMVDEAHQSSGETGGRESHLVSGTPRPDSEPTAESNETTSPAGTPPTSSGKSWPAGGVWRASAAAASAPGRQISENAPRVGYLWGEKMGPHLETIEVCVEMVAAGNVGDKPHGELVVDL